MPRSLHILLASPKPPPRGGIGTWTELVLEEASRHADLVIHHVDIAPRWRGVSDLGTLRRVLVGTLQGLRDAARIRRILRTEPVSVLHVTTSGHLAMLRDYLILRLAARRRIPALLHIHFGRLPSVIRRGGWEWRLTRLALRRAAAVIVVDAESEAALSAALPGVEVRKLANGVALGEPAERPSSPDRVPEILYLGWLFGNKGVRELVEAWSGITGATSRLSVVGPGDPKLAEELRRLALSRGVGDRFELSGEISREQASDRLRRADICVLASHSEGFPYAVLEAMASGRAIVATTVGAIPEMLDHGGPSPCGVLVPPRDIESLRAALESLLSDPERRRALGRLARAKVEREYALPLVFRQLSGLWESCSREAARAATPADRASDHVDVVLVSPKPPPRGGIGTWTEIVLAEADRRGDLAIHHVDIAPHWRGIHQLGFFSRMFGGLVQGFRDALRVRAIVSSRPVQALSLTSTGSLAGVRDNVILSLARRRGIRSYLHMRIGRVPEIIRRDGWEWALLKRAMRKASAVVVLDQATESALAAALPEVSVRRIPNCISLGGLSPIPDLAPREVPEILYLGWMLPNKGVRELVDAWTGIASPSSRLVLIGPGDVKFMDGLRRLAIEREAGDRLEVLGEIEREQAIERMRRADLCVLPSYSEGFPYVVAEAMACGKAIVATAVGAIPEMLGQNGTAPCGVLVKPRQVEPLRTALESLLRDPDRRRDLGRLARARVEAEYATPVVFERLVRLWHGA